MERPGPDQIHLPLERLLAKVEDAGIHLDTRRRLRLLEVFKAEAGKYVGQPQQLGLVLGPFICSNPEEQKRFEAIFELFWKEEVLAERDRLNLPAPVVPQKPAFWKFFFWVILFACLGFAGWGIFLLLEKPPPPLPPGRLLVKIDRQKNVFPEGRALEIQNKSSGMDSVQYHWEVSDQESGVLLFHSTAFHLYVPPDSLGLARPKMVRLSARHPESGESLADTLIVDFECLGKPAPFAIDAPLRAIRGKPIALSVQPEKGCRVEWTLNDGSHSDKHRVTYTPTEPGEAIFTARVYRPGQREFCFREQFHRVQVGEETPSLAYLALHADDVREYLPLASWVWWLLALPLLLLASVGFLWWKNQSRPPDNREKAKEKKVEFPVHDKGPYHIPYNDPAGNISVPSDFYRIAETLRARKAGERLTFDVSRSIAATLEQGGFPVWRQQAIQRPTEFLFLIQMTSDRDQTGKLFQQLTNFLTERDVLAEVYFFKETFENFWNERTPKGVSLSLLHRKYPDHNLVVFGNGYGIVDPYTTIQPALLPDVEREVRQWPFRLLLTPEPVDDWSYREALLLRLLPVFPANTEGILAGVQTLREKTDETPPLYGDWLAKMKELDPDPGLRYQALKTVEDYRGYFAGQADLFRWLCALSVCTNPDFALTVSIGKALGLKVTHDRLLQLTRIPWLRSNRPNHALRLQFQKSDYLAETDERLARGAVWKEMHAAGPKLQGSFAELEQKVALSVQQFALNPTNKTAKQSLTALIEAEIVPKAHKAELDQVLQHRYKARKANRDSEFPTLIEWLKGKPARTKAFYRYMTTILALLMLFIAGLITFRQYNRQVLLSQSSLNVSEPGLWQQKKIIFDSAAFYNNEAVRIWNKLDTVESFRIWAGLRDSARTAEQYLERALALRGAADNYPLADSNRLALTYNLAIKEFNYFLSNHADTTVLPAVNRRLAAVVQDAAARGQTLQWTYQHARGLTVYYYSLKTTYKSYRDTAVQIYKAIETGTQNRFFDTLSMPVNLKTLLYPDSIPLLRYLDLRVLDRNTVTPVAGAEVSINNRYTFQTDPSGRLQQVVREVNADSTVSARINAPGYDAWEGKLNPRVKPKTEIVYLWPVRVAEAPDTTKKEPVVPSIADDDADGVANADDKCPDEKGLPAFAGCPDQDNDGIPDREDDCPKAAGSRALRGCPDTDGDGIADHLDNCPREAGLLAFRGCPADYRLVKSHYVAAAIVKRDQPFYDVVEIDGVDYRLILQELDKTSVTSARFVFSTDKNTSVRIDLPPLRLNESREFDFNGQQFRLEFTGVETKRVNNLRRDVANYNLYVKTALIQHSGQIKHNIHPLQWHLKRTIINGRVIDQHINVEEAWKYTFGAGVTIAVIDDGFDLTHPEFAGRIIHPRDVSAETDDPSPKNADDTHGMAVAGIALAAGLKDGACGVAPESKLMPIRLRNGLGSMAEVNAFKWAVDKGADIIVVPWGPSDGNWWDPGDALHQRKTPMPDATRLAIEYALKNGRGGKGCVILVAAGNGNENMVNDGYASHPSLIAVGSANDSGTRAVYSDYGENLWLVMPSGDYEWKPFKHPKPVSEGLRTTDRRGQEGYSSEDYINSFSGTTGALPQASGVVALMLAVNPNLSWQEVKEILKNSCDKVDAKGGKYDKNGHSIYYGYGRLNAGKAVANAINYKKQEKK